MYKHYPQQAQVVVGMSGGVDSSVAAALLVNKGYKVSGLFMKNWEEDDSEEYCPAAQDRQDAIKVCEKLKIPLHTINFSAEYWDFVFEHFLQEYKAGRTPNPDILCNREIKFKAFLNYAMQELQADYIATGHYADLLYQDNNYFLRQPKDLTKDQTYFLYTLNQSVLAKTMFPLAELTKPEVRALAAELQLDNFKKKDSTGICFIGERKFKDFLQTYLPHQPGDIITTAGEIIGKHDGLMYHTIGQRQGLKIGGLKNYDQMPWYVCDKDLPKNQLIVCQGKTNQALFSNYLIAEQLNWITAKPNGNIKCQARIRHRQQLQDCEIILLANDVCKVSFTDPQWAISCGQSVVFYAAGLCIGGGVIVKSKESL